jgi:hypothetical protein
MMMTIRQVWTHTSKTTIAISEEGELEEAYVEHGAHNVDTTFLRRCLQPRQRLEEDPGEVFWQVDRTASGRGSRRQWWGLRLGLGHALGG